MRSFDEINYLLANPDVALAVKQGAFSSGRKHFDVYGRREGRPLHPDDMPKSRQEKALTGLDIRGLGLEIGPSHNPIAPKAKGFNIHILDHLSATELKIKYKGHGLNLDNIEDVDFVWNGEPLSELIGRAGCYDYIIASHVIEHVPDLISFLRECETLLAPGGKISLIIPDKRYCFDHFGAASNTGEVLDAWHERRTRPTPGQVFHMYANAVRLNGQIAWSEDLQGTYELGHPGPLGPHGAAIDMWNKAASSAEYYDVHCWRFVPASFDLLFHDLRLLGLISLSIESKYETCGCEFFIVLSRDGHVHDDIDRLEFLRSSL
jgi:SAM-dependent methyltransferase